MSRSRIIIPDYWRIKNDDGGGDSIGPIESDGDGRPSVRSLARSLLYHEERQVAMQDARRVVLDIKLKKGNRVYDTLL